MSVTGKSLLITGASGFIGAATARAALDKGWHVIAALRNLKTSSRLKYLKNDHLTILEGYSLSNQKDVLRAISEKRIQAIIHTAASDVFKGGTNSHAADFQDLSALNQILKTAQIDHPKCRIITFGSSLIYGQQGSPHTETSFPAPVSLYGVNKVFASDLARYYRSISQLSITEFRLFNIYGTGDLPPRLIPACIGNALSGESILLTAGTQKRDFVHINDVTRCILSAASGKLPANIYNVATGIGTAISDVARHIIELSGSNSDIKTGALPSRQNEYSVLTGSSELLKTFGLAPQITLMNGLQMTIDETRNSQVCS